MRDDLLQLYAGPEEIEVAAQSTTPWVQHTDLILRLDHLPPFRCLRISCVFCYRLHVRIRRNESNSSLSNYVHYDFLQKKLKSLEEENLKLRATVSLRITYSWNWALSQVKLSTGENKKAHFKKVNTQTSQIVQIWQYQEARNRYSAVLIEWNPSQSLITGIFCRICMWN